MSFIKKIFDYFSGPNNDSIKEFPPRNNSQFRTNTDPDHTDFDNYKHSPQNYTAQTMENKSNQPVPMKHKKSMQLAPSKNELNKRPVRNKSQEPIGDTGKKEEKGNDENNNFNSNWSQILDENVEKGKLGIRLYDERKFEDAKVVLMKAIENLYRILNVVPAEKQPNLKQGISRLLEYAEQCKIQIEQSKANTRKMAETDPYFKNIKETILQEKPNIKFSDIAGLNSTKELLREILIYPNLRPDLFTGIRAPPKGILFYGPPGNGKTLLAKAVATECQASFFNLSASTLVSKYMGDSEKLMRALFQYASIVQPSIIFIDEVDSILTARSENEHEASRRLKTEFLIQFDGVSSSDKDRVVVIGATNRPFELDTAALRRFTKRVLISVPDYTARFHFIKSNLKDLSHNITDKEFQTVANSLEGYSMSDLKALIKEASMEPLRSLKKDQLLKIDKDQIRPLMKSDIEKAQKAIPPSLKKSDISVYIQWEKKYADL